LAQTLQGAALEDRVAYMNELVAGAPPALVEDFQARFDMSWIYHDSVLEGVVYTQDELSAALGNEIVADSALMPIYDEIRNHHTAVGMIREMAERKRFQVSLEVIKKLYAQLAPEELEGKSPPKYRKDIPLHRLYFHEISTPDKISYRMRQLVQWMNDPETKRGMHPVRLAAKTHYQMLHVYPFPRHSGKVARLVMNLILLRNGFPPVVIHATERQRYYDALKTGDNATAVLIQEALAASIESTIRFYEEAAGAEASVS
jgi:Fic family protein